MKRPRGVRVAIHATVVLGIAAASVGAVHAQHSSVANTVHNLSVSGPGEIRAVDETEVCKFCHVPHNAIAQKALWGRTLSAATYTTPSISNDQGSRVQTPQPNGSSRLCLSCHDGTVALGEIAGEPRTIAMQGASRLAPGHKGFIGNDLSGSHPISFAVRDSVAGHDDNSDIGLLPLGDLGNGAVQLDGMGRMQCTTCHDPHSDRFFVEDNVPRFWVAPSVTEVCLACHDPR
jgi:hypothetical protein